MYEGKDKFSPIQLDTAKFPILINEDAENITSMLTISKKMNTGFNNSASSLDDKEFIVIFNPSMDINGAGSNYSREVIDIKHQFARDVEGSQSHKAIFNLDMFRFVNASRKSITFEAYITSMQFYMPDDSPFVNAVRLDDEEDYTANYGYPYTPPKVTIKNVMLPMAVKLELNYNISSEHLGRSLERWNSTN